MFFTIILIVWIVVFGLAVLLIPILYILDVILGLYLKDRLKNKILIKVAIFVQRRRAIIQTNLDRIRSEQGKEI